MSVLLSCSPAEAARLLFWRFDSSQNRLVFTTDSDVQPSAHLIDNPTRLAIDLPGVQLDDSLTPQRIGGAIASVRVGQVTPGTARLVIELAPGYTIDPQAVNFQGSSATQWSVQLPNPERIVAAEVAPELTPIAYSPEPTPAPTPTLNKSDRQRFQSTQNGFYLRLEATEAGRVNVSQGVDGRQVEINLEGIVLPEDLVSRSLAVDRLGVQQVAFSQVSISPPKARITLETTGEQTDWNATLGRNGLAIVPIEGAGVRRDNPPPPAPPESIVVPSESSDNNITPIEVTTPIAQRDRLATIRSVDWGLGNQLYIRGNGSIRGSIRWDSDAEAYIITIPNAQLAEGVRGPQLLTNGPIAEIRLRQHDRANTVEILLKTVRGIVAGELNQLSSTLLSLALNQERTSSTPISSRPIPPRVSTPPRNTFPSNPSPPPTTPPRPINGRVLITIDPGHGGKDPGAIGIGGLQEKDVVLPISLEVSRILQQNGVQVVMTRDRDYFVSLAGRAEMANRARADAFVSIHANAISLSRPDVNGVETFYYSYAGQRLANAIQSRILRNIRIGSRGVKQARFYVLRNTSMPSALVEVGFVTGRDDAPRLATSAFRSQMAQAIAEGILEYIRATRR
ncbi:MULTISPECIES: N-acetylmuramoyl-L-alanine amidase [Spirulina sp. CCY15215]|uniref:N-acetylmuramoyl-L-alanine amidase n=1 Tax=Spirulina sp. CCY15215 TaxID=2767591 RepID=UPI001EF1BA70|nr:N-acetylmuramoyl-L-alanine amidase [Spirulina major]